jgi:hypothetical protein
LCLNLLAARRELKEKVVVDLGFGDEVRRLSECRSDEMLGAVTGILG